MIKFLEKVLLAIDTKLLRDSIRKIGELLFVAGAVGGVLDVLLFPSLD